MDFIFIFGAKYLIVVTLLIGGVSFLRQPRAQQKSMIMFACITLPVAFVIAKIAGHFYFDPRPFAVSHVAPLIPHNPDNGFPSDHMLLATSVAAIVTVYDLYGGTLLWVVALLIGVSRVYVGVHHSIDIAGSTSIALIAALVAHLVLRKYRVTNSHTVHE